jgi:hypothetical protein
MKWRSPNWRVPPRQTTASLPAQRVRARDHDSHDGQIDAPGPGFELPPGATFEPDPQAGLNPLTQVNKHAT